MSHVHQESGSHESCSSGVGFSRVMVIRSQVLTIDYHQEIGSDQEELIRSKVLTWVGSSGFIRSQVLMSHVHQESGSHQRLSSGDRS